MRIRFIKCIIAWVSCIVIIGFPLLIFKCEVYFGRETWKIFTSLFLILFPLLLLFENVYYKYSLFSKGLKFLALWLILILSEIEFVFLPLSITQVKIEGSLNVLLSLVVSSIFAAWVVGHYIFRKRNLIIVQKEL